MVCVYEGGEDRVFDEEVKLFKGEQNGGFLKCCDIK